MGLDDPTDPSMQFRVAGSVVRLRLRKILWLCVFLGLFIVVCVFMTRGLDEDEVRPLGKGARNRRLVHAYPMERGPDGGAHMKQDLPKRTIMAMEPAKSNYDQILRVQKEMYRGQDRPNDKFYNINVTLSDQISLDRDIDDTRPPICRLFNYGDFKLPKASVIIPFYNEALSMLLRTVHSVLNRSPDNLLVEVILVDDRSTYDYLKDPLDRYFRLLPKVRVLRNSKRQGLIVSRMNGARASSGQILIFLDAHTEANVGWLEPLLDELQRHPDSVIQPFVDGIDTGTIAYSGPPSYYRGAFSWDLRYTWLRLADPYSDQANEHGVPFFSPTLVGCALAVDRDYFDRIGAFDEELKVWGGENIELAFRSWMCGGRVVSVPCSRVGHIFKNFPYKFDGDKDAIVQKNLIRVAETWMDTYKKYFYASTYIYPFKRVNLTHEEWRDLEKRKELRERLQCKSFAWYLNEIVPEIEPPPMDSVYYGEIMQLKSRACFEVTDDGFIGVTYYCFEHKIIPRNYFRLTKGGLLMHREKCVRINPPRPMLRLDECPRSKGEREAFGVWEIVNNGPTWGYFRVKRLTPNGDWEKWCVMQVTNVLPEHKHEQMPQLATCEQDNEFQQWSITYKFDFNFAPSL